MVGRKEGRKKIQPTFQQTMECHNQHWWRKNRSKWSTSHASSSKWNTLFPNLPPITDPNFSAKLGGEILLRTDAVFSPTDIANHGKWTEQFKAQHQKANDKQTEDIVAGIRSGEIPMEGQEKKRVKYSRDEASEGVKKN